MIVLGEHTITDEDLAVIAHKVHNESPEDWATRSFNYSKGGIDAVLGKIAKHKASYLAAKDDVDYKTAAVRQADEDAARKVRIDQSKADTLARKKAPPVSIGNSVPELRTEFNALRQALIDIGVLSP